uniref:Uncharacterized protein n=1 Tax=viral metagenome TaxID=1070528 RepID=A0A6M3M799_9ZZZZ
MRTAKIERGITAKYEITVRCHGRTIVTIRCNDYQVDDNMIVCKQKEYNSYIHVDKYTCETWKERWE